MLSVYFLLAKVLDLMIEKGVDLDFKSKYGDTPLIDAGISIYIQI